MTPIDFVVYEGNSSPNTPVYKIATAMACPIEILSVEDEWEVLSYYYNSDTGKMTLDIERKNK
jgi:hypothetical protein